MPYDCGPACSRRPYWGKIIAIATVNTALYGMKIGLAVWLGFVTTVQLTNAVFSKQPASFTRSIPVISWYVI
jgi:hypothetical protein